MNGAMTMDIPLLSEQSRKETEHEHTAQLELSSSESSGMVRRRDAASLTGRRAAAAPFRNQAMIRKPMAVLWALDTIELIMILRIIFK